MSRGIPKEGTIVKPNWKEVMKDFRRRHGMTQLTFAYDCGICPRLVWEIEKGLKDGKKIRQSTAQLIRAFLAYDTKRT